MAISPEDLGRMTLADAEALAERLEAAAKTIRGAMALMGSPTPTFHAVSAPGINAPMPQSVPHPSLDASELAERTRLLAQLRMNQPSQNVDAGALSE